VPAAVLDSSVAVAWFLADEPVHRAAHGILDSITTGRIEPVVAAHFAFEVRSALIRAARRGRIGWPDVRLALAAIDGIEPTVAEPAADETLITLAEDHRLEWADAHWVEGAARLDLPLVTVDRRLARTVPADVAIVVALDESAEPDQPGSPDPAAR
jgi:predicted nucleic acid-binding protein